MFDKISVRNVKKFGDNGLMATVVITDSILGTASEREVRTNRRGEGLWINDSQQAGTGQFYAKTTAAFRSAVRRWFSR